TRSLARQSSDAATRSSISCLDASVQFREAQFLADVLAKELQGAFPREPGGRRVIRAALIAVEAVVGGIDMNLRLGVRRGELLDGSDRNHRVALAEMREHRASRRLADSIGDPAAVVRDSAGKTGHARRAHPGD